jgi:hypothetical protein
MMFRVNVVDCVVLYVLFHSSCSGRCKDKSPAVPSRPNSNLFGSLARLFLSLQFFKTPSNTVGVSIILFYQLLSSSNVSVTNNFFIISFSSPIYFYNSNSPEVLLEDLLAINSFCYVHHRAGREREREQG